MSTPNGYLEFERLVVTRPDEAWNIAYNAGRASTPDPIKYVPMERFRNTILGTRDA